MSTRHRTRAIIPVVIIGSIFVWSGALKAGATDVSKNKEATNSLISTEREYPCFILSEEPKLDGKLTDAAWRNLPEAGGFFILDKDGVAVERPTFFKAGWTHDAIYLGVRCMEPTPAKLSLNQPDQGNLWDDDDVEVFFVLPGTSDYIQLIVNAKGARWHNGGSDSFGGWTVSTSIGSNAWYAEMKIPFATLEKTPNAGERWKFNIARGLTTGSERSTSWPLLSKSKGFADTPNFAAIVFNGSAAKEADIGKLEQRMSPVRFVAGILSAKYQEFVRQYQTLPGKGLDKHLQEHAAAFEKDVTTLKALAEQAPSDEKLIEKIKNLTKQIDDVVAGNSASNSLRVFCGVLPKSPDNFYGDIGDCAQEAPSEPFPYPFYLAGNETLSMPVADGAYDIEIALELGVTAGKLPEVYINDNRVNAGSSSDIITYRCEIKKGQVNLRSACKDHWFTGIKYIKLSNQNQVVAYADASMLRQTQRRNGKEVLSEEPTSMLETNVMFYEPELGGKQMAANSRIVYQFKLDPGTYTVRLRFNHWRGTYPESAKFNVFLQGRKVLEIREPNRELLTKDFKVKITDGYLQVAALGTVQDACAWLGDISVFNGKRMVSYKQPQYNGMGQESMDYFGLRNQAPNPSFEVSAWKRNWTSLSPDCKPVRTNTVAHHGEWSMCLEGTNGPGGLILNNDCSDIIKRKIREGKLTALSKDEQLGEGFGWTALNGAPIDYTRPYRFTGWVKAERATGQTYLQIVWVCAPRTTRAKEPLIPGYPKFCQLRFYFSILGTSESSEISGTHDWQKLTLDAKPPYGATFAIFVLRSDDNRGKVWFDDLDFDGFGSDPIEVVLPQVGYHPNGEKLAFVKTRNPLKKAAFQLINESGKTVADGKLKFIDKDAWGFYLSQADFSEYRTSGKYSLKVTGADLPECSTHSFSISPTLYRDLGMLSINGYFQFARCGIEAPGWHAACHLDYAAVRNNVGHPLFMVPHNLDTNKPTGAIIKHVDLTGGWHDAGNLDKGGLGHDEVIENMCRFWEDTHYVSNHLKEKYPDILSQAAWGVDFRMRTVDVKNMLYEDGTIDWDPVTLKAAPTMGSDPTDNIVGTLDDPICQLEYDLPWLIKNHATVLNAIPVTFIRFARVIRDYDSKKADELLSVANLWSADRGFLALAIARARLKQNPVEDKASIEKLAEARLAIYRNMRYPKIDIRLSENMNNIYHLFEFCDLYPDSKLVDDVKILMRRICDNIVKPLADNNAYGVVDSTGEAVMTRANASGRNSYAQFTYFLVRSGMLLNDPELIRLGERHIQYLLGRNPLGVSMVGGTGYRVYSMLTLVYPYGQNWFENKGQIPGGLGSVYMISDGLRGGGVHTGLGPRDFPVPQTASELVNSRAGNGEIYQFTTGWFIAACGILDRALGK